ncbi:tryptophan synthase subunit alpha, partial [bacterium]
MARELISMSAARFTMSGMRLAPSSRLYSVWLWRWTNLSDIGGQGNLYSNVRGGPNAAKRMLLDQSMSALSARFDSLRSRGEKALVVFLTAGDQPLDQLPEILGALEEGGADVIEVGIPFSDPFGEGPTIQASSQRALEHGASPAAILKAMSQTHLQVPLVTMGYYNTVLRVGLGRFAEMAHEAGSSGTIVSDLVPDEADAWREASAGQGLDTIFLVAPTSTDRRIEQVSKGSTGFVYIVSRTGVTGAENQVPTDVSDL